MTRDEAKQEFFNILESGELRFDEQSFIDKIYDSFENKSCNWYQQEGGYDFEADCGMQFTIFEGMPSENNMNFCTKCGKKLIEHKHDDY